MWKEGISELLHQVAPKYTAAMFVYFMKNCLIFNKTYNDCTLFVLIKM